MMQIKSQTLMGTLTSLLLNSQYVYFLLKSLKVFSRIKRPLFPIFLTLQLFPECFGLVWFVVLLCFVWWGFFVFPKVQVYNIRLMVKVNLSSHQEIFELICHSVYNKRPDRKIFRKEYHHV